MTHKLELYERAVQHPQAEAHFLARVYEHYRGELPTRLKEDFAGTAAVAREWTAFHDARRALAVERHGPTLRWAQRKAEHLLGERSEDLHFVCDDVMQVTRPRVDIVAALNFSTFTYHDRAALRAYFACARQSLDRGGVLVVDCYGGPGAMRIGTQQRPIGPGLEYVWEQRTFDAVTFRTDCRIHLREGKKWRRSAFRYDWRLWSPTELRELMLEAKFKIAEVWCDRIDPRTGRSDGHYRPLKHMQAREDFVAYVVAGR